MVYNLNNVSATFEGYQKLIDLYHRNKTIEFGCIEISLQSWFAANLCSVLGGLLDRLAENINSVVFAEIDASIKEIIQKNGFLNYYGYPKIVDGHNTTIEYLKLKPSDGRYFHGYVVNQLLKRSELPDMTVLLKKKIAESIYEVFVNAQIHSETSHIYTCGQFFPTKHTIEFTITDIGVGFKNKIYQRFGKKMSSTDAITWALLEGHSTKKEITGGIGLAILKDFVRMNDGKIQIISDDGFYQCDSTGESIRKFNAVFPGTIVNMQFRTDDTSSYLLKNEVSEEDIF